MSVQESLGVEDASTVYSECIAEIPKIATNGLAGKLKAAYLTDAKAIHPTSVFWDTECVTLWAALLLLTAEPPWYK